MRKEMHRVAEDFAKMLKEKDQREFSHVASGSLEKEKRPAVGLKGNRRGFRSGEIKPQN